jgi:acyl-CoA reductase-like NAD-dependent aldehyde dehydrogenase
MPYGGVKESSIGREGARHAIEALLHFMRVSLNMA